MNMDVAQIANLATSLSQAKTDSDIQVAVLKKALDIASSSALALISTIPHTPSENLPSHLGQNINTTA
jgi:hypothetical protein